jgi:hypothetical protein
MAKSYRPVISVPAAGGAGAVVGGTSATTAIPNTADGKTALVCLITVSEDTYVLPVLTGGAVTNVTGIIVTPESGGILLHTGGIDLIAHLQVSGAGRICITPIES